MLEIPKVFDQFKATDAKFEMVTSNTLQKLNLICRKNVVQEVIPIVFVNTGCRSQKLSNVEVHKEEAEAIIKLLGSSK